METLEVCAFLEFTHFFWTSKIAVVSEICLFVSKNL